MTRPRDRRARRLTDAIVDGHGIPAGPLPDEEEAASLRVAIALRGGRPAADLPTEEFVTRLRHELAAEMDTQRVPGRRPGISRRTVLAGAVAAAAGVAGAVADRALLQTGGTTPVPRASTLEPVDGQWVTVANVTDLADGAAHRFETAGLVGFVAQGRTGLTAVSGVCTHQGCLLSGNDQARRLECPCHLSVFGYDGRPVSSRLVPAPAPLPRLQARRRDGSIEVLVPPPI